MLNMARNAAILERVMNGETLEQIMRGSVKPDDSAAEEPEWMAEAREHLEGVSEEGW